MEDPSFVTERNGVDELKDDGSKFDVGDGFVSSVSEEGSEVAVRDVFEDDNFDGGMRDGTEVGDDGGVGGNALVEGGFEVGFCVELGIFEGCRD